VDPRNSLFPSIKLEFALQLVGQVCVKVCSGKLVCSPNNYTIPYNENVSNKVLPRSLQKALFVPFPYGKTSHIPTLCGFASLYQVHDFLNVTAYKPQSLHPSSFSSYSIFVLFGPLTLYFILQLIVLSELMVQLPPLHLLPSSKVVKAYKPQFCHPSPFSSYSILILYLPLNSLLHTQLTVLSLLLVQLPPLHLLPSSKGISLWTRVQN
jgi:hypothetical protein